ncbi:glutamate--cysteine ligase [soil metagenome]
MPHTLPETQVKIPFNGSPRPTLGVELEVQLIDPETCNLTSGSVEILDQLGAHPKIKQELTQSTVEIVTGICNDVADTTADLRASFQELYEHVDARGIAISSAGTHPFAQWRNQAIFPNQRYQMLVERIQWPARRLLIYGLHVHVGVGSGEKAIAINNALCTYIPDLLALSASSPFIDFEDTGLASARSKIFEAMPTAGLPVRLANYGEFQVFMNTLIRAGTIESVREIWWDIRPHPDFGTIEVRVCDAPRTLGEVAALTALIQCLVVWIDDHYEHGLHRELLQPWIVRENKWRATRHGLDAEIIVNNRGDQQKLRDRIPELLDTLEPIAHQLTCYAELQECRTLLDDGASYIRQRVIHRETGSLAEVVRSLMHDFRASVFEKG